MVFLLSLINLGKATVLGYIGTFFFLAIGVNLIAKTLRTDVVNEELKLIKLSPDVFTAVGGCFFTFTN